MVQRNEREPGPMLLIGTPCHECRCEDFLPLCCDGCRQKFCASHIKPESHACVSKPKTYFVPLCPLCQEPPQSWVRDASSTEIQRIFTKHWNSSTISQGGCKVLADENDQQGNPALSHSNMCSKPSCKKVLHVAVSCPHCFNQFCVEHRAPLQHRCPANIRAQNTDSKRSQSEPPQGSLRDFVRNAQIAGSSMLSGVTKPSSPEIVAITPARDPTSSRHVSRTRNIRAKQERRSMILAMQSRHHKGLLTEPEQMLLAEKMAEEASSSPPARPRCPVV